MSSTTLTIPAHIKKNALPAALEATTALSPFLRKHPKTATMLTAITTAQTLFSAYTKVKAKLAKPSEDWSIKIEQHDDLYEYAIKLLQSQQAEKVREVEAKLRVEYDLDDNASYKIVTEPVRSLERVLLIDGHSVEGYVNTYPTTMPMTSGVQTSVRIKQRNPEIIFSAQSAEGQQATLDALLKLATTRSRGREAKRKPRLFVAQGGYRSGWNRRGDLPCRPVESIACTNNQVQTVVDDINNFISQESAYERRGIPFHRGYLLYGPPGTGKTSATKAISHATGRDLFLINLGSLSGDASLSDLFEGIKENSILVMEDIDAFGAMREREEGIDKAANTGANAGLSTSGLLNALDGLETPHGLIFIMTTNHREYLDEAILRPGRLDKHVLFDNPDDATVMRHFEFFFERKPSQQLYAAGRSGADVTDIFIRHMFEPEAAEAALSSPTLTKEG